MNLEKDLIRKHDKMAHGASISAGMFTAFLLLKTIPGMPYWLNLLVVVFSAVAFSLLWEYRDYKLKQKDFGSRKDEVKYDWADFRAFAAGIIFTTIIILITNYEQFF